MSDPVAVQKVKKHSVSRSKKQKRKGGRHAIQSGKIVQVKMDFWQQWLHPLLMGVIDARARHIKNGGRLDTFRLDLKKDIPWFDSVFKKGTQIPTLTLHRIQDDVTLVASTEYKNTFAISLDKYNNTTELAAVFDEYRPLHANLFYHAYQIAFNSFFVSTSLAVGSIDYDDSAAPTSRASLVAYDTRKFFQIVQMSGKVSVPHWNIAFDWVPDTEWLTMATVTTSFAALKVEVPSGHNMGAITTGELHGSIEVQFRLLY